MDLEAELEREWLEADGLGGFASGTAAKIRTRRYHALLLIAARPPAERMVLVSDLEAWVSTPSGDFALSSQRYAPDVVHPDGFWRIASFTSDPWPTWRFDLPDGTSIEQSIFVPRGRALCVVSFRRLSGQSPCRLFARPLVAGRDFHSLCHENASAKTAIAFDRGALLVQPYEGLPEIVVRTDARFDPEPIWYRNFVYTEERARGLDCEEDLVSPGVLSWDLSEGEATAIFAVDAELRRDERPAGSIRAELEAKERDRRARFATPIESAADAYLVRRSAGATIIAGYPWFGDWGRDTFIAMRGVCLATGRLDEASAILSEWAGAVSEGMLPNRFPDRGETPEYNSVDAALFYVVAVREYLAARGDSVDRREATLLHDAVLAIVEGYRKGTRYSIRADEDGLLAAGEPGVQLTWMDAKVGDWVVTPRIGKPVEIQALWINALDFARRLRPEYDALLAIAARSFTERFVDESRGVLHDVVDVNHVRGTFDRSMRPNQIFAVGGLPLALVEGELARSIVDRVEAELLTPLGLRSLAPSESGYIGHYGGGVRERDGAYHQGTVWPWLLGPFVEAWLRVRRNSANARSEARRRFVVPMLAHLDRAGIGHISEIADAEAPYTPRGCPFQAWSVGELIRIERLLGGS